jgi:hypothetical protein
MSGQEPNKITTVRVELRPTMGGVTLRELERLCEEARRADIHEGAFLEIMGGALNQTPHRLERVTEFAFEASDRHTAKAVS